MTNRGKAVLGAGALVLAIVLAFVLARLTTHAPPVGPAPEATLSDSPSDSSSDSPSPGEPTTSPDESLSPEPTGTLSTSPGATTPSAAPSVTVTVTATASASPSATPTSPASTSASAPPPTVAQLVTQVSGCATGKCAVESTFVSAAKSAPSLRFALVLLPAAKGAFEVPMRATLFDEAAHKLVWASDVLTGSPAKGTDGGAAQDATGHIAFTVFVGAHSSNLYVLDPADGKKVRWFGQPSAGGPVGYFSDTGGAHAEDLNGDGIFEVVLPENDYSPSYAEGNTTVFRYAWDAAKADYVTSGCTYYPNGSTTGTDYDATNTKCAAG